MSTSDQLNPIHLADSWVVVNKPVGLATQAPSGIDSMEVRLKRFLAGLDAAPAARQQKTYLGVPHRLDRPASGVMVFARNKTAAKFLAAQFQNRQVEKTYWALVAGQVSPDQGSWTDWMRKIPDQARSELCQESTIGARRAVLHYRVLDVVGPVSLLEICLETGRTHQIRLQCSSRGTPILGDELYGSTDSFGPRIDDARRRGIALHARSLKFIAPDLKQAVSFTAPPPECWPMPVGGDK